MAWDTAEILCFKLLGYFRLVFPASPEMQELFKDQADGAPTDDVCHSSAE